MSKAHGYKGTQVVGKLNAQNRVVHMYRTREFISTGCHDHLKFMLKLA